jgi:preprotein translocase subunit SecF
MIQFLKYRFLTGLFAVIFFGAFIVRSAFLYKQNGRVFSYSVDFTGGTAVLFKCLASAEAVKVALSNAGWQDVDTRSFGQGEVMVRVKEFTQSVDGVASQMAVVLEREFGDPITILQNDSVGPAIGEELRTNLIKATIIALIAMLFYIGLRFWSYAFAIGAFVALVHDAFAMFAMLLFFNQEISSNVIGAILLVIGYSINDTIVIFSQIRDTISRSAGRQLEDIVDESLNYTLRRTILTSLSTLIPVAVMLLFGGDALFPLSFTLFVGVVFGTFSSIYIASPIMMLLYKEGH